MSQQPSRPPSVDSVNLGSIYSGFYPQASSAGPSSLSSNIPPTIQNSYQVTGQYTQSSHQQQQQSGYHHNYPNITGNGPASWSLQQTNYLQPTSQQPTSLPPNLSYQYQISASAAAAAAFGFNFQQQQHQQQQQPQQLPPQNQNVGLIVSPTSNHHNINTGSLTPGSVQWPGNTGHPQSFAPAMTNQILSPTQHQQQLASMAAAGITNPNEYVSQYYSQYYREYYQRLVAFHKHQQQIQNQKKIAPLKYNQFHTPCLFSQHDNQLIVVEPNSNVGLYGLQEVFTEQCYPNLYLQSLLYPSNDDPTNSTLLPFEDSQSSLDWIRMKQLNDSTMNYELKLILKLITMLFRQNGTLTGLDLSELLYELVQPNVEDSEKLSQSGGSEVVTKDYYRDLISHLRQLLMRGQRRVAITFAQNNGLFDHALTLSYLLSFLSPSLNSASTNLGQVIDNNLMISTIKKFITSTLSIEDPLYVFYTHLLQIASNILNSATSENGGMIPTSASGTTASAKIDRLESFIILLANDIKFDKVEIADKSYRNLIDLMIALLKDDFNYILPDELFNNDRFDCLLVNECLEFARFRGERLNPRLILRKLEFAFELFDFGFTRNASRYLTKIQEKLKDPKLEWKMLIDKKSKYSKWLLPESIMNSEDDELDSKLLQNIWSYQFSKIFTRINREMRQFDSPLFAAEQKNDPLHNDETDNNDDVDVAGEEDEDRTDVVEDIEDEEIDVELDTSESSFSKPEQHNTKPSSNQQDNLNERLHSPQQNMDVKHHSTINSASNTPVIDQTLNVSSIEPITVNRNDVVIPDNQSMSQIDINHLNSELNYYLLPSLDSLPIQSSKSISQGFLQQAPRRSLPTIANHTIPRTLNPIMEIPQTNHVVADSATSIHQQQSFDSLDSSSPPSSPKNNFNMNSLQSALS
ncbi:STOP and ACE1 domain containing 26s proteosome regulatory subunit, partial [Euroglyphus maynei]